MKTNLIKLSLLFVTTAFLLSCNSLRTAVFDQYSYQKAIEIKVDASRLMDESTSPFMEHSNDVTILRSDIKKILMYEENKPNNGISYQMWQLLANNEKNLLAGYFKKWEEDGQLSEGFIQAAKPQIVEAMDLLIQYESKKDKESKESLMAIILGN